MSVFDRFFKLREEGDHAKPFLQHLEELRWMFIKMALTLFVSMGASLYFQRDLVNILQRPLHQIDPTLVSRLQNLGVTDPFTIAFQLAFYAGLVISFPLLLFYAAQFIVPALTRKEMKYIFPAIAIGFGLFLAGVCFAYFWVVPQTLEFFFNYSKSLNWVPTWTVREYFSFVTQMTISLGLAFELPVAVLVLVSIGILSYEFLSKTRPYAYVLVLVLAAVIAPTPDLLTFLSLGLPMCFLYEICIWIAWVIDRRRTRQLQLPLE